MVRDRIGQPTWIYKFKCFLILSLLFFGPHISLHPFVRVLLFQRYQAVCFGHVRIWIYFIFGHIHKCLCVFSFCLCFVCRVNMTNVQCLLIKIQQMTHSMRKTVELILKYKKNTKDIQINRVAENEWDREGKQHDSLNDFNC